MTNPHARLLHRAGACLVAGVLAAGLAATPAWAQSAATAYQRAQTREQRARRSASPAVPALRAIATSYEAIVRSHPTSGYCDNALWQAAGLLQLAYQHGSAHRDRDNAARLLKWLKKEYPTSPFARQVDEKLASLGSRETITPAASATAPVRAAPPAAPSAAAPVAPKPVQPRARPAASTVVTASSTTPAPGVVHSTPLAPLPEVFHDFPVTLRDAAYIPLPKGERFTIELTQEVTHGVESGSTADQVWLTFPGVTVAPSVVEAAAKVHGAMLRGVRISPRSDGLAVKLDLASHARYSTFPLYDPYRIVIDVDTDETASPGASALSSIVAMPAAAGGGIAAVTPRSPVHEAAPATSETTPAFPPENRPLPPASTKAGGYSLARQLGLGVSRIVIDPGHGGHDPGAQANGVSEAELVLDVSKRLEALLLDQPGVEVVLTRRTNEFIPLEERTAIANRENADLFLSIHANSSPQHDTRGIETYFLNFASNPQAEAVAARENASSAQAMNVLPQIVKAITLNNKLTESRELATHVQTSMLRRLSAQNKAVKDLGVKQAPFVVLIGAQMPSVLAEISFLTNKADAALLKQGAYRQRIAQALCDAVLNYQSSLKKVGTVAQVEAR